MTTWRCASCDGENPEGMRFCGHCGSPMEATAPPPTSAPQREPDTPEVTDALRGFVSKVVAERLEQGGGRIDQERRLVTALFADISGFTSLAERLDPEQLLEVIDPIVSRLTDVVGRYEGHVEKFAGDALLALFGAPVSHEDDAERALLVAGEMHEELARLREELPYDEAKELTLHVGVNTGHGIARVIGTEIRLDYAVLGDSVILAQRLESAAPSGETYVGETTWELASDHFDFETLEPLELKGKLEPVQAYRLLGRRAVSQRATSPVLIGRDEELSTIAMTLDDLAAGRGGVLAVLGEPGVGKSRLTREVELGALERGFRWLDARCVTYGARLPYLPLLDVVRRGLDLGAEAAGEDAEIAAALATIDPPETAGFLARLFGLTEPHLLGPVADLEPEAFRRGLHDAIAAWCVRLAADRPVVIAIEDVHWIDASSAALVRELMVLASGAPVLVYVTARPEDEVEAMLDTGGDAPRRLHVEPLGADRIGALVASLLGAPAGETLLDLVTTRTGGNPFFVEEVVRSLRDSGALEASDAGWQLRAGWDASAVPATVEGVLSARIDMLDARAVGVLQIASVIGRRIPVPLLAAVGGPDDLGWVDQLVARGFVDPGDPGAEGDATDGVVVFHHALVQEVAYTRLLRRTRKELHQRVADEAERLYGDGDDVIDLLARHRYHGDGGPKALDALSRAAARARALFANDEAMQHLQRAVEVARGLDDPGRLDAAQLDLAELCQLTGVYADALAAFGEVRARSDDERAWRGIVATLREQGSYEEAARETDAAAERFGDDTPRSRWIWFERGWKLDVDGSEEAAIEAFERGLALSPGVRDAMTGALLLQLTHLETVTEHEEAAAKRADEAIGVFEDLGDLRGLAKAYRLRGFVAATFGDQPSAIADIARGLELARRVGGVVEIASCLIDLGVAKQRAGDLEGAIETHREAITEFERIGHGEGRTTGYTNLAEFLVDAGQAEEAVGWAQRAIELSLELGDRPGVDYAREQLTRAESALGRAHPAPDTSTRG